MTKAPMKTIAVAVFFTLIAACSDAPANQNAGTASPQQSSTQENVKSVSERYVKLILGIGEHEEGYIDAYYGPPEWAEAVVSDAKSLPEFKTEAAALQKLVQTENKTAETALEKKRFAFLSKQLVAANARIRMLEGEKFSFDEETKLLFDAVAPTVSKEALDKALATLDKTIEGEGELQERFVAFTNKFVIPADKLSSVIDAAIQACKANTEAYIELPKNENFTTEYVTKKPWSGYNWYKGSAVSLIQINTDLPSPISAAVNLGCHEGYPGHHVFNALLEENLVNKNGWTEFSVYPLFSPQSFLAEGTASYGRFMAFMGNSQTEFESAILYPLAGLDPTTAQKYTDTFKALNDLRYARIEGARRYLNGDMTREETIDWLARYQLTSKERAEQGVRFIETYRGYVINYTLGADLTKAYVDEHGGNEPKERWAAYYRLISEPFTASMMQE